jgi:hypothetical protein
MRDRVTGPYWFMSESKPKKGGLFITLMVLKIEGSTTKGPRLCFAFGKSNTLIASKRRAVFACVSIGQFRLGRIRFKTLHSHKELWGSEH